MKGINKIGGIVDAAGNPVVINKLSGGTYELINANGKVINKIGDMPGLLDMMGFKIGKGPEVPKTAGNSFKEINIHGKINTELDEIDLVNKIIYEDKSATKLYMDNPDFPQTEEQWAYKQIYKKGSNRIQALHQSEINLSSSVSDNLPSVQDILLLKIMYLELMQILHN
ncbi:hypothetical protein [Paenibacillus sp. TH7-28]